jgi:hypothetical protein
MTSCAVEVITSVQWLRRWTAAEKERDKLHDQCTGVVVADTSTPICITLLVIKRRDRPYRDFGLASDAHISGSSKRRLEYRSWRYARCT